LGAGGVIQRPNAQAAIVRKRESEYDFLHFSSFSGLKNTQAAMALDPRLPAFSELFE
jgi:hypothetical protein